MGVHLGEKIKYLVDHNSGTGRDLAAYLNIPDSQLSRMYKSKSVNPDLLIKVAKHFKVDINFFFTIPGKKENLPMVAESSAPYGTDKTELSVLKAKNAILQETVDKLINRINATITS